MYIGYVNSRVVSILTFFIELVVKLKCLVYLHHVIIRQIIQLPFQEMKGETFGLNVVELTEERPNCLIQKLRIGRSRKMVVK